MTSLRFLIVLCAGLFVCARLPAADATASPAPPATGATYALVIGGLGGSEPYMHWYDDWTGRFHAYLTKSAGVPEANVTVLTDTDATAAAITDAIAKLAQKIKPEDQFILFIAGHGQVANAMPTLELQGPDINADQLAAALNAIASKNQVILNFSASSGDFLKHLVSPARVNIAATSPTEVNEPVFAEFFLRGLESNRAGGGKPGPVNMLDAYNWATDQTALWIVRWTQVGTPPDPVMWKASGKETIEIFEKLYPNDPSRKLDPSSDRKAADAVVAFTPPNGEVTADWENRRAIDEHATLEDCGQEIGVSALGEKGFQPILGQNPNDPGYLSAHTVLGQPAPPKS